MLKVFKIVVTQFHKPDIYARWARRFEKYCRIWLRKVQDDHA